MTMISSAILIRLHGRSPAILPVTPLGATILTDPERVHPRIRSCVSRLDVMRIGHAMVRPTVGAVFSAQRRALKQSRDRLVFAHSDVSGLSLFEEAQFRGVTAADRVLRLIA